jgi:hypothetical protein
MIYRVRKNFDGDGQKYVIGQTVESPEWKNVRALLRAGFLEIVDNTPKKGKKNG